MPNKQQQQQQQQQSSRQRQSSNTSNTHKTSSILRVVAPATLEEGFTFDVLLHGEPYTVTVPAGGVEQGEEFDIPYPDMLPQTKEEEEDNSNNGVEMNDSHSYTNDDDDDDDEEMQQHQHSTEHDNKDHNSSSRVHRRNRRRRKKMMLHNNNNNLTSHRHTTDVLGAPIGRWRYPIYACCDVLTQATFWMACCCCTPILLAQLVTRLGLNWKANVIVTNDDDDDNNNSKEEEASLSFNRIVLSFVAVLMVGQFFPGFGLLLTGLYMLVLLVWIGGNLRHTVRQRYRIPPTFFNCNTSSNNICSYCCSCHNDNNNNYCYERIEDGLCMCVCGSCALIQMARQTHNDKEYPGLCCTTTGLERKAPEIPYDSLLESPVSTESSS